MIWGLIVAVAVVLIAAFVAMLARRLPFDTMSEPTHTTPAVELPADAGADDINALRFDTALRGYRMDQVDEALRILRARIGELEAQAGHGHTTEQDGSHVHGDSHLS